MQDPRGGPAHMVEVTGIELIPMRQLTEAKDYVEDDWTGLSDLQARRKRQNRLSKRAQRRRNAASKLQHVNAGCSSKIPQNSYCDLTRAKSPKLSTLESSNGSTVIYTSSPDFNFTILFPLSSDHLLTLIQFNLYRATWINLALVFPAATKSPDYLSEMNICPQDHLSNLNISPHQLPSAMPSSLTPTVLQRQIRHIAWIDAVPLPALRDTAIMAAGTYDEDELCLDVLGGLFYSEGDGENNGVMVWGDPWNIARWEMTEGFARKWGFLLKGCQELFDATNYWRRLRQEDPLAVGCQDRTGFSSS